MTLKEAIELKNNEPFVYTFENKPEYFFVYDPKNTTTCMNSPITIVDVTSLESIIYDYKKIKEEYKKTTVDIEREKIVKKYKEMCGGNPLPLSYPSSPYLFSITDIVSRESSFVVVWGGIVNKVVSGKTKEDIENYIRENGTKNIKLIVVDDKLATLKTTITLEV